MLTEIAPNRDREIVGPSKVSEDQIKEVLLRVASRHGLECQSLEWKTHKKTSVLRYHVEGRDNTKLVSFELDLKNELKPLGCEDGAS